MLCSIKLLAVKHEYIALPRQEVHTFSGIVSSVMGRKLDGESNGYFPRASGPKRRFRRKPGARVSNSEMRKSSAIMCRGLVWFGRSTF